MLLAIALTLRLAFVGATFDTPTKLDPADFSRDGLSLAQGHGFAATNRAPGGGPSAFRPPVYPLFLGAVYASVGEEAPPIARLIEALLGTVAVALIGLIATRLWNPRVGTIAMGVAALAPPLVVLSTALVSEAVFVPLILAAVAAALEARRSPHPLRWAIATGTLIGLAELTRTNAAVVLPVLVFAVWTARPRWRVRSLLAPAAVALAACLTVAPWTLRNWLVLHAFVPVSTEVGYTLAGTYNRASRADTHWPAVWKEAEHGASMEYGEILFSASTERWNEWTLDDHLLNAAIADIRSDPSYVLKVGFWNTVRMLHLGELDFAVANLRDTGIPQAPAVLEIGGFYLLGLLAVAGLGTAGARRPPLWLWLVPLSLVSTIFVTGFIRFRSVIDPFLVLLAALAIVAAADRRKRDAVVTRVSAAAR